MSEQTIVEIPLNQILSDTEFNCRGHVTALDVAELAKNIKQHTLLQPIVVQPWTVSHNPAVKYRIIMGHRRFMAHKVNKAETIKSIIKQGVSNEDALAMNLIENLQRSDLNIIQEAHAVKRMSSVLENSAIAKKLNKSNGWVATRIRLLDLPEEVQKLAAAEVINQAQINDLWQLPSVDHIYEAVKAIKDKKLFGTSKRIGEDVSKVVKKNESKVRGPSECFAVQTLIQDYTETTHLAAKVIAWQQGIIEDWELHEAIAIEAQKYGKHYFVPSEFARV